MTRKRIKRDIIDNITDNITMRDILSSEIENTTSLDISTGYFDVAGYGMLCPSLNEFIKYDNARMRLLLGKQALVRDSTFEDRVNDETDENHEDASPLKSSLGESELTKQAMLYTTSLVEFLKKDIVQVRLGKSKFNHSKCYIFDDDSVFIGSSNFTRGGLIGNYELNAGLYQPSISDKARVWFDHMWGESRDAKQELIDLLESSKFGVPATPYEVYIKMIFEKYRDILVSGSDVHGKATPYGTELAAFQKEAVRTSMFILSEFQGVMIADATGLGKTNMGMEILRQKILGEGRKALLVAPSQVLNSMWDKKLRESGIMCRKAITMESLGRENALDNWREYSSIDFVLIDESQNFRSNNANRSKNLAKIMTIGKQKQVLMLSATPINNSIMDLYHQISIITCQDDTYFWRKIGIPDFYKHMRDAANKEGGLSAGLEKIQRLLDGIMVRRTRSYIKEVYPQDLINDKPIKFPEHEYSPIHYSLSDLYGNIFAKILEDMNKLTMAPYGLERYNAEATKEESARHVVLAHLQVIRLLKMFESSVVAIKTSLDNMIRLYKYIGKIAKRGKMLRVRDLNKIIAKGNHIMNHNDSGGDEDSDDFDMDEFLFSQIQNMETEEMSKKYDMKKFLSDLRSDLFILEGLRKEISDVTTDKKLEAVRDVILKSALKSESKKVLIFTEYVTTAKYLHDKLRDMLPDTVIECITGGTKSNTRSKYIDRFAPESNLIDDQMLQEDEIDILISTEVLAEGQNLQDCNYVINYDLPWNPMRIVQRIGRVDRLASKYDIIHSRACYPDKELDSILKLMGRLLNKINTVNRVIGLDAELLGETPTPHQYNGHLKNRLEILGEGGKTASDILYKMERDSDLMPQNTPLNEIAKRAKEIGIDELRSMPIGRRSGKIGNDKKECILAYVRQKPERRVYFVMYDYEKDEAYVPENEYDAVGKAQCSKDEEVYLPMDDNHFRKSFEEIVRIDKKAREAISNSDDKIRQYVKKTKNTGFDKTRTGIKRIFNDALKTGKIDAERGGHMCDIADRVELQPWETDLENIVSAYEQSKDIELVVKEMKRIGEQIGIRKQVGESEESAGRDVDYDKMKLVGAVFITPQNTKPKNGLDEYTTA